MNSANFQSQACNCFQIEITTTILKLFCEVQKIPDGPLCTPCDCKIGPQNISQFLYWSISRKFVLADHYFGYTGSQIRTPRENSPSSWNMSPVPCISPFSHTFPLPFAIGPLACLCIPYTNSYPLPVNAKILCQDHHRLGDEKLFRLENKWMGACARILSVDASLSIENPRVPHPFPLPLLSFPSPFPVTRFGKLFFSP